MRSLGIMTVMALAAVSALTMFAGQAPLPTNRRLPSSRPRAWHPHD